MKTTEAEDAERHAMGVAAFADMLGLPNQDVAEMFEELVEHAGNPGSCDHGGIGYVGCVQHALETVAWEIGGAVRAAGVGRSSEESTAWRFVDVILDHAEALRDDLENGDLSDAIAEHRRADVEHHIMSIRAALKSIEQDINDRPPAAHDARAATPDLWNWPKGAGKGTGKGAAFDPAQQAISFELAWARRELEDLTRTIEQIRARLSAADSSTTLAPRLTAGACEVARRLYALDATVRTADLTKKD